MPESLGQVQTPEGSARPTASREHTEQGLLRERITRLSSAGSRPAQRAVSTQPSYRNNVNETENPCCAMAVKPTLGLGCPSDPSVSSSGEIPSGAPTASATPERRCPQASKNPWVRPGRKGQVWEAVHGPWMKFKHTAPVREHTEGKPGTLALGPGTPLLCLVLSSLLVSGASRCGHTS